MRAKQKEKQKKLSEEERRRVSPKLYYCRTSHLKLHLFRSSAVTCMPPPLLIRYLLSMHTSPTCRPFHVNSTRKILPSSSMVSIARLPTLLHEESQCTQKNVQILNPRAIPSDTFSCLGCAQNEAQVESEACARRAAQEAEVLRKMISQLPRPTMAARTETSVTLSMARLARATSNEQVDSPRGSSDRHCALLFWAMRWARRCITYTVGVDK